MKPKILVTGGAGYIGAHTVLALMESGYHPIIVDDFSKSDDTLLKGIKNITGVDPIFYKGNCGDKEFMESVLRIEKDIMGIIHFAAYKSVGESVQEPLKYYRNNIDSLLTVLEVMPTHGIHNIIFSSSCTVYGEPDQVPVTEKASFKKAESPYGTTKQMCENILEDTAKHQIKAISLRYFNPIGAHPSVMMGELPIDVPANLVPYVTQTAIGKRNQLTIFGDDYDTFDGTCIRDFIHVMDLANAHVKALDYLSSQTESAMFLPLNLGTGQGVSVLELVKKFETVNDVTLNYSIGSRRAGDVVKTYADPSLAKKLLGWSPQFSLDDALKHAWQWEKKLLERDQ